MFDLASGHALFAHLGHFVAPLLKLAVIPLYQLLQKSWERKKNTPGIERKMPVMLITTGYLGITNLRIPSHSLAGQGLSPGQARGRCSLILTVADD